jgi:hypothetical protein
MANPLMGGEEKLAAETDAQAGRNKAKRKRQQDRRQTQQDRQRDRRQQASNGNNNTNKKEKDKDAIRGPMSGNQSKEWSIDNRQDAYNKYLRDNLGIDVTKADTDYNDWLKDQWNNYETKFGIDQGARKGKSDGKDRKNTGVGIDYNKWLQQNVKGNALSSDSGSYQNFWADRNRNDAFARSAKAGGLGMVGDASNPFAKYLNGKVFGELTDAYSQNTQGTSGFNDFLQKQDYNKYINQFKGESANTQGRSLSVYGAGPSRWSTY